MSDLSPSEYNAILRSDFGFFAQRCFSELNPQAAFATNWHLDIIAANLTAVREGRVRRLIINLPPRHLKSLMASIAFRAWCLGHGPSAQILCVSYAQDLADKCRWPLRRSGAMGLAFALPSYQLPNCQPPTYSMPATPARRNGSPAMAAAMRAATAMRRATSMCATATCWAAAMRRTHREVRPTAAMWATSHSATAVKCGPAVKCRGAVERGRASMERRPAMGCGRGVEQRPAVKGRFTV